MQVQCFRRHALRPEITIHSWPSTDQITNLIKCRVATGVTPTYNATNTPNEVLSHSITCSDPSNESDEISVCFCRFFVYTMVNCFVSNNPKITFITITTPLLHIPSLIYI